MTPWRLPAFSTPPRGCGPARNENSWSEGEEEFYVASVYFFACVCFMFILFSVLVLTSKKKKNMMKMNKCIPCLSCSSECCWAKTCMYTELTKQKNYLACLCLERTSVAAGERSHWLQKFLLLALLYFRQDVFQRLVHLQNFQNQFLPNALRQFFREVSAPDTRGDYLSTMMDGFSERFCSCNPKLGLTKGECYNL